MVKHRIPTLALHPCGGKHADISLLDLLVQLDNPRYRKMLDYAHEKGLRIEYEMHSARFLLPASEFDNHPEWFRMTRDGQRSTYWNFCASNEEALDYIAKHAAKLTKKLYLSTDRYFLWLDDAKDSLCHCPACSKLSPSDQQLKILNHILKRLKMDNSNASLSYLAYFECVDPPKEISPTEGIFLEYAPFERDFHSPLQTNWQSKPLEQLLGVFGTDTAKALDYWYDNSLFSNWTMPPKPFKVDRPVLESDFDFYRSLGFEDIGSFACYLGQSYEKLHGEVDIEPFAKAFHTQIR